jgi:hypothetical protein
MLAFEVRMEARWRHFQMRPLPRVAGFTFTPVHIALTLAPNAFSSGGRPFSRKCKRVRLRRSHQMSVAFGGSIGETACRRPWGRKFSVLS